jgi:hypothetical protein
MHNGGWHLRRPVETQAVLVLGHADLGAFALDICIADGRGIDLAGPLFGGSV